MRVSIAAIIALASSVASAQGENPGGECTARPECRDGLRCLNNVCVDDMTYQRARAREDEAKGTTIGYLGASLATSLPAVWGNAGEAFQVGFRLGMILESLQLGVEISPVTTVFTNISSSPFTSFDAVATIGYLLPLNDIASWIIRVGGGAGALIGTQSFGTQSSPSPLAFGEIRVDVFGVAIRTSKHLLVEFNAPSFRVMFLTSQPGYGANTMFTWFTSLALNYVF